MKSIKAISASLVVQGMLVAIACGTVLGDTLPQGALPPAEASLATGDWIPVGSSYYLITAPSEGDHYLTGQMITFRVYYLTPLDTLPPSHLRFGLYGDVSVDLLNRPGAWLGDTASYGLYVYILQWTVPNRQGFDAYPPLFAPLSPTTGPQYGCFVQIKREVCSGGYCWYEILDEGTNIVLVVHGGSRGTPVPCDPTQEGGCMSARAMQEFSTWGRIKATFR